MTRPCPKCGCPESYAHNARPRFTCKACKHQFTKTSGTLWHSPKMPPAKRNEIIALLQAGNNPRQVSIRLGLEYKTVWSIAKKIGAKPKWRRVMTVRLDGFQGQEKADDKPPEPQQEKVHADLAGTP